MLLPCPCYCPGSEVTVDMEANVLTDHSNGKTYPLKPIGDVSEGVWLVQSWPTGWPRHMLGMRVAHLQAG